MATVLGRSIEAFAPSVSYIVLVVGDFADANLRPLQQTPCRIVRRPLLRAAHGSAYWRGNASKIYAWSLFEFERVLFLDADCWLKSSLDAVFGLHASFICCPGPESPMNAARMLLRPNPETYQDLLGLVNDGRFDADHGWNEYGEFVWPAYASSPRPNQRSDWRFNAAENDQGLFWYYFHLLNDSLTYEGCGELAAVADHLGGGERKFERTPPTYQERIESLGLRDCF
ncbi:MAG TPA: hypothetical protein VGE52_17355 [Pirellulales bacterium]